MVEQTVRSLLGQSPCPRVVVVDNAPETDCLGSVRDLRSPTGGALVEVIEQPGNPGFAGGLEVGMRYAMDRHAPDWLWLLDDDSPVDDGSLQRAMRLVEDLPPNAVLGAGGALIRRGRIVKLDGQQSSEVIPVPLVLADGALFSAEAVRQGGLPRPDLFFVFEDFEYSLRLGRAGVPLFVGPAVVSLAHRLGSTGGAHPWRAYYQTRNHLRASLDARSGALLVGWAARLLRQIIFLVVKRPELWRESLRCRLLGAADGVRNRMGKRLDPAAFPTRDGVTPALAPPSGQKSGSPATQ